MIVRRHVLAGIRGVLVFMMPLAMAVDFPATAQDTTGPTVPRPGSRFPERIVPQPKPVNPPYIPPATPRRALPDSTGSLSERLDRNDGVLPPPPTGAPSMQVPAPVPYPNTTPVIPPPGSPGNPSPVEPK